MSSKPALRCVPIIKQQMMSQVNTADQPRAQRRRDTEHRQPHDTNNTITVKQQSLSSSAR